MKLSLITFLVLACAITAKADSGNYDITGSMEFVSGAITEQVDYSFDLTYSDPGFTASYPFVTNMNFSSTGPFVITTWDDMVASSEYVGFFDVSGDEFDQYIVADFPSTPTVQIPIVWGCKTAECESLYGGNSFGRTTMLYYDGTADPEVTPTPEPKMLLMLASGLGLIASKKFIEFVRWRWLVN